MSSSGSKSYYSQAQQQQLQQHMIGVDFLSKDVVSLKTSLNGNSTSNNNSATARDLNSSSQMNSEKVSFFASAGWCAQASENNQITGTRD